MQGRAARDDSRFRSVRGRTNSLRFFRMTCTKILLPQIPARRRSPEHILCGQAFPYRTIPRRNSTAALFAIKLRQIFRSPRPAISFARPSPWPRPERMILSPRPVFLRQARTHMRPVSPVIIKIKNRFARIVQAVTALRSLMLSWAWCSVIH